MHRHIAGFGVFSEQVQQELAVGVGGEDRLPVVAALNQVVRVARDRETGKAGH